MEPLSTLLLRSRYCSIDSAPMLDGIVLFNLLPLNSTVVRDVRSPIADGMEPDIRFPYNVKSVMYLKAPISDGIVPVNP